jgi:hypothetical protein
MMEHTEWRALLVPTFWLVFILGIGHAVDRALCDEGPVTLPSMVLQYPLLRRSQAAKQLEYSKPYSTASRLD